MRPRFASAVLLLLGASCAAPTPGRHAAPPGPPPAASAEVNAAPAAKHPLKGTIIGSDGTPLWGVRITLFPKDYTWNILHGAPVAQVESGPDGVFRVDHLEPGFYGITAYRARATSIFGDFFQVKPGVPIPDVKLSAGKEMYTFEGKVQDDGGRPLPDADVRICRPAIPADDMLFLPQRADGRYEVKLPAGEYFVVASAKGHVPAMIHGDAPKAARQVIDVTLSATPEPAMRDAAIAGIKASAIPLRTPLAGSGFDDMQALRPVLRNARVVALGEATHGSREIFQLKHRMLEFLATEMGFTVFAIETNLPEARAVNEYVLNGKGDPGDALAGLYGWPYNTVEVLELINWMRRYNVDPKHPKKLTFYGVDAQMVAVAVPSLIAYLTKVDPSLAASMKEQLTPLATKDYEVIERMKDKLPALLTAAASLERRLDAERAAYIRRSDASLWTVARQDATVVRQFLEMNISTEFEVRDRCMAEMVRRILDDEGPQAKMVLWAHNGHVATGPHMWTRRPMGRFLRDALGDALYVFGSSFNQGGFRAVNVSEKQGAREGVVSFHVDPPGAGSLEGALAAAGFPLFALDLRALPSSGPAREWWRRGQLTREVGAIFSDDGEYQTPIRPLESYDGLLFVESTTPSRAHIRVKKEAPADPAK